MVQLNKSYKENKIKLKAGLGRSRLQPFVMIVCFSLQRFCFGRRLLLLPWSYRDSTTRSLSSVPLILYALLLLHSPTHQ